MHLSRTTAAIIASIGTFAVLALAACSDATDPVSPSLQARKPFGMPGRTIIATSPAISLLSFEVHGASLPDTLLYDVDLASGSSSASLSIPIGEDYSVTVRAYDKYGAQTHVGALSLPLVALGTNKPVVAELKPVTDGVSLAKVQVGLVGESRAKEGTHIIVKAPESVNQGSSTRLIAEVLDGAGNVVALRPGDLQWAIDDPQGGQVNPDPADPRIANFSAAIAGKYSIFAVYRNIPIPVPIVLQFDPIVKLSAGFDFTCGLRRYGEVDCWGYNQAQQIGVASAPTSCESGSTTCAIQPQRVTSRVFTSLATGWDFACAIESGTGDTYCWGDNYYGEVGIGTHMTNELPAHIANDPKFQQLTAGENHVCGIANGTAYCWGNNEFGQLGDGQDGWTISTPDKWSPTLVSTYGGWTQLTAGENFTCGLQSGASEKCWGYNWDGEMGNGSTSQAVPSPTSVYTAWSSGTLNSLSTDAIGSTMCTIDQVGGAWCWGLNSGAIINPSGGSYLRPVPIVGGASFTQIATGSNHACAIDNQATVYCWGQDYNGQTANSGGSAPQPINSTVKFWQVVTGARHSCALAPIGRVYCWGSNVRGQLGNNAIDTLVHNTPERVWGT
jgi:alpha-tubulin suppressor-like RCC1 family protein